MESKLGCDFCHSEEIIIMLTLWQMLKQYLLNRERMNLK